MLCYRRFILVSTHTSHQVLPEKRMKQIASQYDVTDGPNDEGEMSMLGCPGGYLIVSLLIKRYNTNWAAQSSLSHSKLQE